MGSIAKMKWAVDSVYEWIHIQAELHPEKTAAICGTNAIDYRNLDIKSDTLAAGLLCKGIDQGDRIAIMFEPGIELIIAILGILKAGCAYIPLSTDYPPDRISNILQTAKCHTILCDRVNESVVSNTGCNHITIDDILALTGFDSNLTYDYKPDDTAYILFTSGSTGNPKGVNIRHQNLSYYTNCIADLFENTVGNRLPLTSSVNFAAAVSQIYSCLSRGETLHILPGLLNDPHKLFKWYEQHPDYGLYCVPTVWSTALEWLNKKGLKHKGSPAVLFLSGENIPDGLITETFMCFPGIEIWNLYGPTEGVANLSYKRITPNSGITIGAPLPGTRFYVIRDDGNEADINEQGLLYASGPGICAGYVGNEKLTDSSIFDYQSANDGLVRIYNTGDIVERIDENDYKFIGRKDQQVKISGQRIELLEIENHLNKHPDVSLGVISLANTDKNRIVAHLKTKYGKPIPISGLREHMLAFLTEVMVPERWVFVDEFPRLANGKINRKALPEPSDERPDLGSVYVEATGKREKMLVALFERVLNVKNVGLDDNFFELGGNSLKVLDLLIEIEDSLHYRLDFQTIFNNPTTRLLLEIIPDSSREANKVGEIMPAESRVRLTPRQKGLWFYMQAHPENMAYNIAYAIKITGNLDIRRFEKALEKVILHHYPLHSIVRIDEEIPYFCPDRSIMIKLNYERTDLIPKEQKHDFIRNSISSLANESFVSGYQHPFRFRMYRINDDEHILGFVVSHLVFDGGSVPVFIKELNMFYNRDEAENVLPSAADITQNSVGYEAGARHDSDFRFWKSYLKGVGDLRSFPKLYKKPPGTVSKGGRISTTIDGDVRKRMASLCMGNHVTLNMLLLGAFGIILGKFGGHDEYVIASPVSNRLKKGDRDRIGYFVNTVLYRLKCTAGRHFSEVINDIKKDTIRILDHQQTPLHEIADILRKEGVKLPDSFFKVMFGYHEVSDWSNKQSGITITASEVFNGFAKCDIHMECFDDGERINVEFTYDKAVLNEEGGLQVVRLFKQILNEINRQYDSKLTELAPITESEKEQVIRYSVGDKKDYGKSMTLYHLFSEASRTFSDNTAISFRDEELTYGDLQARVTQCIRYLSELGLTDEEPVGIYMDHTPEMVIAILAASALSHPYVSLDPTYPDTRNKYILDHAGLRFVLTTLGIDRTIFDDTVQFIAIDEVLKGTGKEAAITVSVKPSDLLYIIYTSGSTGKPKGVMVPNRGVANYLLWMKNDFNIDTESTILAKTSLSFDISVWELFLPLIAGGTLVLENRSAIESPEQMARIINQKHVNIVQFVPSGLKLFCDSGMLENTPGLSKIFSGGEKLPVNLADDVLNRFRGELHNLYGPTEASIFVSHYRCTGHQRYESVPIGRPIPNSSIYILDKNLRLLPRGVPGYIYIGGDVLAEGYRNDVNQTRKAFLDGTGAIKGRIYCTGDMGRMLFDGNLEFLGRNDHQVKIRGYRVELGEIESVISAFPGVKQAVVYKNEYEDRDIRLHALIVPREPALSLESLKNELRTALPQYMIPNSMKIVKKIPLLANGKINFKEIEKLEVHTPEVSETNTIGTKKEDVEHVLFNIWSDVIGQKNFSVTDNFFDVGGHSILFLKIRDKIKEKLNADFSIVDLYEYPNIKALAAKYREKYNSSSPVIRSVKNRIENRKRRMNGKR